MTNIFHALNDVAAERARQDKKWGEQNHLDGTSEIGTILYGTEANLDLRTGAELARIFTAHCDRRFSVGEGTWRDILLEEVFEALAEEDPVRLREELVQVAAVAVAWVEAIDRRETSEVAA